MTYGLATVARISAGIVIWAAHFGVIYGSTALACAREDVSLGTGIAATATLAAAMSAAVFGIREWRRRERFESWLGATIAALAFVAIVFEGVTILMVPRCG
jgi:hypothetical protein